MWFWSIFEPANNFLQGMQNGPISYSWCCTKHVVFILMQHLIATGFSIAFTFEMVRVEKRKRMDDDPVTSVTSGTAERSSWSTVAEEKWRWRGMTLPCRCNAGKTCRSTDGLTNDPAQPVKSSLVKKIKCIHDVPSTAGLLMHIYVVFWEESRKSTASCNIYCNVKALSLVLVYVPMLILNLYIWQCCQLRF